MFRKCRSKRREAVLFGKAFSENSIFSFSDKHQARVFRAEECVGACVLIRNVRSWDGTTVGT